MSFERNLVVSKTVIHLPVPLHLRRSQNCWKQDVIEGSATAYSSPRPQPRDFVILL